MAMLVATDEVEEMEGMHLLPVHAAQKCLMAMSVFDSITSSKDANKRTAKAMNTIILYHIYQLSRILRNNLRSNFNKCEEWLLLGCYAMWLL
jgi:cytochrome c-type biogenesis protein CcmH/NrfG